ncbi:phosphate starvation-inducible protein PhoH [Bifidobacterium bohemicum]|uniref:PhoH-like protein n=1 Tax=Bifidobacterium bohemicum DSM 22767 TaxID=1437606 RepID=A0A086ZJQ5_9BIFI|nr:PhoH protein [Bifidobacterium bohemicum DSM 22767]SCB80628.1 phosphate starvation-inducible protein PhoH [Bifidobacterium bohemicum]
MVVLGPGDSVLRQVERAFPTVRIFVRGDRIELSAYSKRDEVEAEKAADALDDIIESAWRGPVDARDVRRVLEGREVGKRIRLSSAPSGHVRHNPSFESSDTDGLAVGNDIDRRYGSFATNREFSGDDGGADDEDDGFDVRRGSPMKPVRESAEQGHERRIPGDPNGASWGEDESEQAPQRRFKARMPGVIAFAHGEPVRAKTAGQVLYAGAIDANTITFGIGPAGTGKTYLAVAKAVRAFEDGRVSRIILTRPAVEAGESLGFLPGTLNDKVNPYLRPLYDALSDMLGAGQLHRFMTDGTIEVAPLAYMRGRTLNDAFVILDEAQNTTTQQMKMFLTRLGFNTKMVITGDVTQIDLAVPHSGLRSIERILGDVEGVRFVHLGSGDVVRHELVGRIVEAYDAFDRRNRDSKTVGTKGRNAVER